MDFMDDRGSIQYPAILSVSNFQSESCNNDRQGVTIDIVSSAGVSLRLPVLLLFGLHHWGQDSYNAVTHLNCPRPPCFSRECTSDIA